MSAYSAYMCLTLLLNRFFCSGARRSVRYTKHWILVALQMYCAVGVRHET